MTALALPTQFGPITLAPYQQAALVTFHGALDQHRCQIAFLPTGCGKTVLGVAVGLTMRPRGRVLILVHRKELVDQWLEKIDVMWPECRYGVIKAEKDGWFARDCVVASVQSLSQDKRLERLCMGDEVAFIIVDETHHAPSETWMKILLRFPKAHVLGLTATPTRADKKTLAQAGFTAWCYRMNAHEAIRFGYLAPLRAQTVPLAGLDEALSRVRVVSGEHGKDFEKKSLGRVMEELRAHEVAAAAYAKHASSRKGIIFTVTVEQARKTAEALSALGIVAGWVSGDMESTERARVLREHREGKIRVVANCGVLTEGYDDPSIDCGLIARPTQSKGLYVQMAGRVLRKHPAKKFALILDMVGAHEEHGLVVAPRLGKAPSKEEEEEEAEGLEVLDRFEPEGEVVNEEACVEGGAEPVEKGTMEEDIVERFLCAARGVKSEKVVEVHAAQWVECGPALFALSLGPDEGSLVLYERGGSWLAERTAGKASEHIAGPSHDLGLVQGIAENYARDKGALGLSVERAIWRASEPTPEQERVLASMPTFYVEGITRGEAQDTILAAKVRSKYGVHG